jgi:hypothetical protein
MIRFNAAPAFDFDEWATLYKRDPEAFEARRKALLAIEIARGGVHAEAGKRLVAQLEAQLAGRTDAERINLSMLAMRDSAQLLARRLGELSSDLAQQMASLQSKSPSRPGAPDTQA